MTKNEIQNLITTLSNQTQPNSITPTMVADILRNIVNVIPNDSASGASSEESICQRGKNIEFFFGHTIKSTSTTAVECSIVLDDDTLQFIIGQIVDISTNDDSSPLVKAIQPCLVEITGYLTVQADGSYTSDRIFQMYKIDEDGERVDGQVNAVHFTDTAQVFSVPINYMAFMFSGETLHLTTYTSSGTTTISANSWLNIKAVPVKM